MSAIQIVCAVAVPLLWGYQFVAIKVGLCEATRRGPPPRSGGIGGNPCSIAMDDGVAAGGFR